MSTHRFAAVALVLVAPSMAVASCAEPGNVYDGDWTGSEDGTSTGSGAAGSGTASGPTSGPGTGAGGASVGSGASTGSASGGASSGPGAGGEGPGPGVGGSSASSSSGNGGAPAVPPCAVHDGDVGACDADPQDCAYFNCSDTCWPMGTQLAVGCGAGTSCDNPSGPVTIGGDEGADDWTLSGHGSRWATFYLDEVSSGVNALAYTVTLETPAGATYALSVLPGDGTAPSCSAAPIVGAGSPLAVSETITDFVLSDQGKWLTVHVAWLSGDHDASWKLTVQGNFAVDCQTDGTCTSNDDCMCSDCDSDAFCSDPANCVGDGICDPYWETCGCADCAPLPQCP
jgi:hypothetical protein